MELFSTALKIAAETGKLGVETVKNRGVLGVETVESIGALGVESVENIGKIGVEKPPKNLSFGSLADGSYRFDERYQKWQDGIESSEVHKEFMEKIANEISKIFGHDVIGVPTDRCIYTAAMDTEWGEILYDAESLSEIGNKCGEDSMVSIFAHEVGHRLNYNVGLREGMTRFESEACADYIAGLVTRLSKLNPDHMIAFYDTYCPIKASEGYPGVEMRKQAFLQGYSRIDRGAEATALKTYEDFGKAYDFLKTYHDKELICDILMEDIITPLRLENRL